jgi:hypothetical protein
MRSVIIAAVVGFALSSLVGLFAGVRLLPLALRALVSAVVCSGFAALLQWVFRRFLVVNGGGSVAPQVGKVLDITVDDGFLPESDTPTFDVRNIGPLGEEADQSGGLDEMGFDAARSAIQNAATAGVNQGSSVGGEDSFTPFPGTGPEEGAEPVVFADRGAAALDREESGGFGPLVARDVKTGAVRSTQESSGKRTPSQLAESLDSELAAQTIQSLLAGDRNSGIGGDSNA